MTLDAYSDGLVDAGFAKIPKSNNELGNRPSYHGSVLNHIDLLKCGRELLSSISTDERVQKAAAPTLFHPDLHKRNIFVSDDDPSIITGFIDWQSSSIEPAFWYADEVPDFATCASYSSDNEEVANDLCREAFEVCVQFLTPKLAFPRSMKEGIFRPFRYCYRTWNDGIVALRQELIETSQDWEELGFATSCPFILPAAEDISIHHKQYKLFEAAQNLKRDLSRLLDCASDGWVPADNLEAAQLENKAMFNGMLQAVLASEDSDDEEPVKDESSLRMIWPFDIPDN
ncbi:hypothetical protein N7528_003595 [Penicillium herquei]|nr:hypothetical protein N7528_003595 [Penicillium herquei]